jgi:hypothetical protein
MRHFGYRIGCGGGYYVEVCPQCEFHVAVPLAVFRVEEVGIYGVLGQRGKRERLHKLFGGVAHKHTHLRAGFFKQPYKIRALVSRDAAGDAEEYFFARQHTRSDLFVVLFCF